MAVLYSKNSPYADTKTYSFFLDVAKFRDIPKNPADVVYRIDSIYEFRPDLLAFDLYGDVGLWWVFCMRNPNTLQDPVFDFTAGTTIFIPKKEVIAAALGV